MARDEKASRADRERARKLDLVSTKRLTSGVTAMDYRRKEGSGLVARERRRVPRGLADRSAFSPWLTVEDLHR